MTRNSRTDGPAEASSSSSQPQTAEAAAAVVAAVQPTSHRRPQSRDDFGIAIICALTIEADAVEAVFDEIWEDTDDSHSFGQAPRDSNSYTLGRIGRHNVVLTYLAGMGSQAAANVAAGLTMSFSKLQLGLLVGICGGVPFYGDRSGNGGEDGEQIFLGDIIISTSIVQYDFGRRYEDGLARKNTLEDSLGRPSVGVRNFIARLKGRHVRNRLKAGLAMDVEEICSQSDFDTWRRPPMDEDILYAADFRHMHRLPGSCPTCENCSGPKDPTCVESKGSRCEDLGCSWYSNLMGVGRVRQRAPASAAHRDFRAPEIAIHFGPLASGNSVMKSAADRDEIARREGVLGFEMEGVGIWDSFPTIVVKGVCDYADSHKSKRWQKFAAVVAAACAKGMLREWRVVTDDNVGGSAVGQRSPTMSPAANTRYTPAPVPAPTQDNTDPGGATFTFHNQGPVQMQAGNQTIHGGMHFGPVSHNYHYDRAPMHSGGINYGSQVGYNFGTVQNNDYRQQQQLGRQWRRRDPVEEDDGNDER